MKRNTSGNTDRLSSVFSSSFGIREITPNSLLSILTTETFFPSSAPITVPPNIEAATLSG